MRKREIHICPICNQSFETGGRAGDITKVFCSVECRRIGRYRKGKIANTINDLDAAYVAGFVDGEGSIMITERNGVITSLISITNTKRSVLDWICEIFGVGKVAIQHGANEKHVAAFFWRCSGDSACSVLKQLKPYMRLKQSQVELAIEAQLRLKVPALKADKSWQMEYRERMKLLNKRGTYTATLNAGG